MSDPRQAGPASGAVLADRWAEAVERHAGRPAVRDSDGVWTYAEFDRLQRRIGEAVAARVPPAGVVGVVVPKSAWSLAAMVGVVNAGRAAVLLDPDDPPERRRELCERAHAALLLAEDPAARHVGTEQGLAVLGPADVDRRGAGNHGPPVDTGAIEPESDGWIVCTSGSTGTPKLVAVSQTMLADAWDRNAARNEFWGDLGSSVLVLPPLSSAAIRMAMLQAWAGGACAVLVDSARTAPDRLLAMVDEYDVHRLHLGPWLLRALVEAAAARGRVCDAVSVIVSTGAPLTVDDVAATWRWFPRARIRSHYGSTEVAGVASVDLEPGDDLRGMEALAYRPEDDVTLRVVADPEGGIDAEPGGQGEIWVHARRRQAQYRDAPELTARTTVADPEGRVWTRTGDLGRLLPDGRLLIDGRDDARVKVNGIAVDLNAVTAAVRSLDRVHDAEVSVLDRGDDVRLVAWVVAEGGAFLTVRDLRAELASRLPPAMIPHVFRAVSEIPRLRTGKADRVALREAAAAALPVGGKREMPATPLEAELAARFEQVLACPAVGVDESFFELGGDSLGALELITGIVERYAVSDARRPALESAMLTDGTVAALARVLEPPDTDGGPDGASGVEEAVLRPDGVGVLVLGSGPPDGVPIVLLPGGGQDPLAFRPLVRRLAGCRVWTLTPRGFRSRVRADRTLPEMVARFADALLEREPRGEFVVAGFSFGAVVAQELAAELVGRGATVRLLGILDAPRPGLAAMPVAVLPHTRAARVKAPLWVRIPRGSWFRLRWWYLGATAGMVPRTGWVQGEAFLSRAGRLLRRWSPREFTGPTAVVRSAQAVAEGYPPDLGWSTVCTGPLESFDVPGNHFGVLLEPSVARIGEVLGAPAVTSGVGERSANE